MCWEDMWFQREIWELLLGIVGELNSIGVDGHGWKEKIKSFKKNVDAISL